MSDATLAAEAGLPDAALVVGYAATGQAVAAALLARGVAVTAIDDRSTDAVGRTAAEQQVPFVGAPSRRVLDELVEAVGLVVVSPGVPPSHPVFAASDAAGVEVVSEIELAARVSHVPLVAITGTNGKTTVTSLVAAMLTLSGVRTAAVGNIGPTLISAVDESYDLLVCEVSSFQLALTLTFKPTVGTWINLAEDHLDWHRDIDDYAAAKARIWAAQDPGDVAVANLDDPVVMSYAKRCRASVVTFGRDQGDYHLVRHELVGPSGALMAISALSRAFPHDVANALAALATAIAAGADEEACVKTLTSYEHLPHRVHEVARIDGVAFVDDSKATTPSAVEAALAGFSSVVLIAGGRNKGLDLSSIRRFADASPGRVKAVVAIGDSSDEIVRAFDGYRVERASSMRDAVGAAASLATRGDVVLLSPGCASFDWYRNYEERGEDFAASTRALGGRPANEETY